METSRNHIPSLLSAMLFVVGALFLLGIGLIMGVGVLASILMGTQIQAEQTVFLVAFSFEGLILLAAAYFSFQKFLQKPAADQEVSLLISNWLIAALAVVAGLSILVGYLINEGQTVDWLFLPILTIPAVGLPLAVLLAIGIRKLPFGTRWQTWNVLGLGMSLIPIVLFTLEVIIAVVIFFVVIVYVVAQPELAAQIERLSRQLTILGPDSEAALELLAPLLTRPGVVVTALFYMAVLVPAIEEIFKPLGVWLFASKLESQAQGFTLGALSGAAYGLIETIGVSGQTAEWASLLFTRIGTGLLHITTSALMGGAIVLAWRERRYLRFLGIYLFAVLLHGSWNTLAILFSFSTLAKTFEQAGRLSTLQPATIIGLSALAVVLFAILVISNRRMRKTLVPASLPVTIVTESVDVEEAKVAEIPLAAENTELTDHPDALSQEN